MKWGCVCNWGEVRMKMNTWDVNHIEKRKKRNLESLKGWLFQQESLKSWNKSAPIGQKEPLWQWTIKLWKKGIQWDNRGKSPNQKQKLWQETKLKRVLVNSNHMEKRKKRNQKPETERRNKSYGRKKRKGF